MESYTTATVTAKELAEAHPPYKVNRGRWQINCPAHGGDGQKLTLWDGQNGVGAKCHTENCSYSDIMTALGVKYGKSSSKPSRYAARRMSIYRHADGGTRESWRADYPDDWHEDGPCSYRQGKSGACSKGTEKHKHPFTHGGAVKGTLPQLWVKDDPDNLLCIVEGEPAAEKLACYTAQGELEGVTPVSYIGGGGNATNTQWGDLLLDRTVVIWPDPDDTGRKGRGDLIAIANSHGAEQVLLVSVDDLGPQNDGDKGSDAADLSAEECNKRIFLATAPTADAVAQAPVEVPVTTRSPAAFLSDPNLGSGLQFEADHQGLWAALRYLRLDIRQNRRNLGIEIARDDWPNPSSADFYRTFHYAPPDDGWVVLTDEVQARILTHISEVFTKPSGGRLVFKDIDFRRAVLSLASTRGVNPVELWLGTLPAWDGSERLSKLFVNALGVKDCELYQATARAFFISAVARALSPGCKVDLWPYLISSGQGKGKSTFCRLLLPKDRQEGDHTWFSDSLDLNDPSQKRREQVGDAWIVEYPELPGLSPRRTESTKKWVSQQEDRYRPPWYKVAVKLSRSFVVIATGNDTGTGVLPNDTSGDRRFVVVTVPETTRPKQVREYLDQNRVQLWAEALNAFKSGEEWWFGESLEREQTTHNSRWQRMNEAVVDKVFRLTGDLMGTEPQPLAELMLEAGVVEKLTDVPKERGLQLEFASQLRKTEWERVSRRGSDGRLRKLWKPPVPKPEPEPEMEQPKVCRKCGDFYYPPDICCITRDDAPPGAPGTDAGATQPALGGVFTGAQLPLTVEIERRLTQLASFDAELRAGQLSATNLLHLDQCKAYRLGLEGFAAVNPAFTLNPGHVAALGGAFALLNIIQIAMLRGQTAKAVVDRPPDWKGVLGDLHRVAVERQQEARQQVSSRLLPHLVARTQPRLKGI